MGKGPKEPYEVKDLSPDPTYFHRTTGWSQLEMTPFQIRKNRRNYLFAGSDPTGFRRGVFVQVNLVACSTAECGVFLSLVVFMLTS